MANATHDGFRTKFVKGYDQLCGFSVVTLLSLLVLLTVMILQIPLLIVFALIFGVLTVVFKISLLLVLLGLIPRLLLR